MRKILNLIIAITTTVLAKKKVSSQICEDPSNKSECRLVKEITTDEIFFDFSDKNKEFTIIGENCEITAYRNISIIVPSDDYSVLISLTNCSLKSKDVSIDLGSLESNSKIALDKGSSIDADAMSNLTKGTPPDDPTEIVCYTGCNRVTSAYVYGSVGFFYDISKGDSKAIKGEEFYGSADNDVGFYEERLTWGGGRVYVRASTIHFVDRESKISSNGYQGEAETSKENMVLRSGTGGTLMIAASRIVFQNSDRNDEDELGDFVQEGEVRQRHQIQAEGSYLKKQLSTNLGGGGRILVHVLDLDYNQLREKISVSGYGLPFSEFRANSGIARIKSGQETYLIMKNKHDSFKLKTAGTLLQFRNNFKNKGNNAYYENCNVTNLLKNKIMTFDSVILNSTSYTLLNSLTNFPMKQQDIGSFIMDAGILQITNESSILLNTSGLYDITTSDGMLINDSSNITLFQGSFVRISGPSIKFSGDSVGNIVDTFEKYSSMRPPTVLIIKTDEIIIQDSFLMIDKILLFPSSNLTIQDSTLSNVKSSCPSDDGGVRMDWFLRNCEIQKKITMDKCSEIWVSDFLEMTLPNSTKLNDFDPNKALMTTTSFVIIDFPGKDWRTNSTFIKDVGYFAIKSKTFELDKSSVISSSAAGCSAQNPQIDSVLTKYIKPCKVKGGSNLGRGTLGIMVNLQQCNFLMPLPKKSVYRDQPVPVNPKYLKLI